VARLPGSEDAMTTDLRRARRAVFVIFFANGAGLASWVPHVPMVQARLGLRPSVLGLALLAMAVGALVGIPLAGRVAARIGSRAVVRASAVGFFAALGLPVLAPSLPALVAALFVLGASNGALDVSMNAQAAAVEARRGRSCPRSTARGASAGSWGRAWRPWRFGSVSGGSHTCSAPP
jgi:predicted MFS family arabinose efflux permease